MARYETALEHIAIPTGLGKGAYQTKTTCREIRGLHAMVARIDGSEPALATRCEQAGFPLPQRLQTIGTIKNTLNCWISADEYLLLFANAKLLAYAKTRLAQALHGTYHALVDTSGTYTYLLLRGHERITTLRKLCSYNLETSFPPGKIVSTLLAKAPVSLVNTGDELVLVIIRNSFADYVYRTVAHAMEEFY